MKVELRQFIGADVDDLEAFDPPRGTAWSIQADVTVAPAGSPLGGDIFQFEVCSEEWIAEKLRSGPLFASRLLVVRRLHYDEIVATIEKALENAARQANSWKDFARTLNVDLAWEYENYRDWDHSVKRSRGGGPP